MLHVLLVLGAIALVLLIAAGLLGGIAFIGDKLLSPFAYRPGLSFLVFLGGWLVIGLGYIAGVTTIMVVGGVIAGVMLFIFFIAYANTNT